MIDNATDTRTYLPGSYLEIPGLEAIFEYGDLSKIENDHFPGAMLINDQLSLERIHVTQIDGLHDDPEGGETRQANADRHGERAGKMFYRGRTIGITGRVQAGNIGAMRMMWRKLRSQFGTQQRDLLVHHPYEIRALANEIVNPTFAEDTFGWVSATTTGGGSVNALSTVTDGIVTAGSFGATASTGAGLIRTYADLLGTDGLPMSKAWSGEDVWLFARVKAPSSSFSSINLILAQWNYIEPGSASVFLSNPYGTLTGPAANLWIRIAVRIPASSIKLDATHLTMGVVGNFGSSGTRNLYFTDAALVFVDPADTDPPAFFDGSTPGYNWSDIPNRSRSTGPTHVVNQVQDPRIETLAGWAAISTSVTVNQAPIRALSWTGDVVPASVYMKSTKDNNSTSRAMGITATPSSKHFVHGRKFRWSAKVNILQKPATGNVTATISWYDKGNALISSVDSDPLPIGVSLASVEGTAPTNAEYGVAAIYTASTTTALSVLELLVSDPCFMDITDWDSLPFFGLGELTEEVDSLRRLPRPFLLRDVRKVSDMKAPEQQSRNRAWRDFTMSLRASDPRIYCLDERNKVFRLNVTEADQKHVVSTASVFESFGDLSSITPTGYTGDGASASTAWHGYTTAASITPGTVHPNGGKGFKLWQTVSGVTSYSARPTTPPIARFYRSSEGYTYAEPRIVLGGAPVSKQITTKGFDPSGWFVAFNDGTGDANKAFYNYVGVIVKRVSSTTWLEMRWNALSFAKSVKQNPLTAVRPYSFELWCSHNTSGTLATTRLGTWDDSVFSNSNTFQHDVLAHPYWLEVQLLADVITWSLWDVYPTFPTPSGTPVETGTYSLPAPLQSIVGSSVTGTVGAVEKVDNPNIVYSPGPPAWQSTAGNPPYIHYMEFMDPTVTPDPIEIPVIGDIDTPPVILLKGPLTDPLVTFQIPDENGVLQTSQLILEGDIDDIDTLTIDVRNGLITDSGGSNRYGMIQPGSRLPSLRPGINKASVIANSWDPDQLEHLKVIWRDALS